MIYKLKFQKKNINTPKKRREKKEGQSED